MPTRSERTVFYSWQSDLPSKTNRGLIRDALDKAIENLNETIDEPIRADSDTQGVPGARDIHQVILDKLESCDAAVFDVSPVDSNAKRCLPNPNVMLELGYGLASPGIERVVLVLNTAYGKPEDLPFDIRNRPVVTYSMSENEEPASARKMLAGKLAGSLQTILHSKRVTGPTTEQQLESALRDGKPDRLLRLQEYFDALAAEVEARRPDKNDNDWDQRVIDAYDQSLDLTASYAQICRLGLHMLSNDEAPRALRKLFTKLFSQSYRSDAEARVGAGEELHDFERLMTQELFAVTVDCFIQAEKFSELNTFFETEYQVANASSRPLVGKFWSVLNTSVRAQKVWGERNPPNGTYWISAWGELHRRRFESERGRSVISFERLRQAELVMFHRAVADQDGLYSWHPCCMPYQNVATPFLDAARTTRGAHSLATVLGLGTNIEKLRERWTKARDIAVKLNTGFRSDIRWIGTEEIDQY